MTESNTQTEQPQMTLKEAFQREHQIIDALVALDDLKCFSQILPDSVFQGVDGESLTGKYEQMRKLKLDEIAGDPLNHQAIQVLQCHLSRMSFYDGSRIPLETNLHRIYRACPTFEGK